METQPTFQILFIEAKNTLLNAWTTNICCKGYYRLFYSVQTTFHTTQITKVLV
jgi:hypothetical protein